MGGSFFFNYCMHFQTSVQNNAIETHTYLKIKNYRGKQPKHLEAKTYLKKRNCWICRLQGPCSHSSRFLDECEHDAFETEIQKTKKKKKKSTTEIRKKLKGGNYLKKEIVGFVDCRVWEKLKKHLDGGNYLKQKKLSDL